MKKILIGTHNKGKFKEISYLVSKEYKKRCPVCRTNLLKRKEISKYMFWSIENKFKL